MSVTVLTCTGDRHEAFALCEKYYGRQTVKVDQWIVMDDGVNKTECTLNQEYHYVPEMRGPGSMARKLAMALSGFVKHDTLFFGEDDDWVAPDWIEFCLAGLKQSVIFGEGRALYYNVRGRWWHRHENMGHASLCSTACRRESYEMMRNICQRSHSPWVDVEFWNQKVTRKVVDPMTQAQGFRHRVVGIKSMPGLVGYSDQHKRRPAVAVDDTDLRVLRSLIGDDADAYKPFYDASWITGAYKQPAHLRSTPIMNSTIAQVNGHNWFNWLNRLRGLKEIQGMEIGTFNPDVAEWMMTNVFTEPNAAFWLVAEESPAIETAAREKLKRFPQARFHRGNPTHFLHKEEMKCDLIYVDRAHDSMNVLRDSVFSFELLKPGGFLIFGGYKWAGNPNATERPKMAIDGFASAYMKQLRLVEKGDQVVFAKR